jgi:hypothetical protein
MRSEFRLPVHISGPCFPRERNRSQPPAPVDGALAGDGGYLQQLFVPGKTKIVTKWLQGQACVVGVLP